MEGKVYDEMICVLVDGSATEVASKTGVIKVVILEANSILPVLSNVDDVPLTY